MQIGNVSRREFVLGTTATLLSSATLRGERPGLTAQQIVDRIKTNVGVPWRDKTTDGLKAGDPSTIVTGVATTVMATLDTLKRAAAAGQNFVITQEPTFYAADDEPGNRANDAVYRAKKSFIEQQRLVVWRFSEHWNARQPNDGAIAIASTLGWGGYSVAGTEPLYQLPETTLGAVIDHVRGKLKLHGGLRAVGQKDMRVRTVFVSPGTTAVSSAVANLRRADVLLTGEPREWEAVPYALDTWSAGHGKGLISIGRLASEEPGMQACASWIRSLVPEVRVEAIAGEDLYWSPRG